MELFILDSKFVSSVSEKCCDNTPFYEIIYNFGTKWLVCGNCLEREEFSSGIKEKVRIKK